MYELYEAFIEAYKSGDEGRFVAAVRNWMAATSEVPFEGEAGELFFSANRAYHRWQSEAINRRYSKKQMVAYAKKLAELNIENPYIKIVEKAVEPTHVLGVVPEEEVDLEEEKPEEEKHSLFGRKRR